MIGILLPIFLAVAFVSLIVYVYIINYFLITSREVKRIEATTRAPLISNLQEALNGTIVIRAFDKESQYFLRYLNFQHRYIVSQ
jgi:ABC-type multidrug transport system fused ATPase/permease subunit